MVLGRPHDDVATADMRAVEAGEIAAWIAATVAADGLRHADVAILLPTRTALPALETALEAADVPYRVESRSLVWATEEISELLAVLRAVDDPADEVALLAALRTPAFGCGDDDLVDFVRLGGRFREGRRTSPDLPPDHPVVRALAPAGRPPGAPLVGRRQHVGGADHPHAAADRAGPGAPPSP